MNLPPPPTAPSLKPPLAANRGHKSDFNFSYLNCQQIEERLNKTRDLFARSGPPKCLSPQVTQLPCFFLPTNSIYSNEAIAILPRIENDGFFHLAPRPSVPEVRSLPFIPSKYKTV